MAGEIKRSVKAFFVTLLIVGWVGFLFAMVIAQETPKGAVEGMVVHRDKEVYKGPVAGARVVISGGDTAMSAYTDEQGRYRFPEVPVGTYWMNVVAVGLQETYTPEVEVSEGKTAQVEPAVMQTRPPDMSAGFSRSVFVPDEKIRMNVRGYSPDADSMVVSVYRLDVRSMLIARNSYNQPNSPWKHIQPEPVAEWEEPMKRDAAGEFEREVVIPAQEEGGYLVRARMGDIARDNWFTVSNLALVAKHSKSTTLAYCVDFKTQKPVEGASITVYNAGQVQYSGSTGPDGLYAGPPPGERSLIVAEKASSFAATYVHRYGRSNTHTCLIYTDRPVYRPKHTVHFKGILRERDANFYRNPGSTPVSVNVKDPSGRLLKHLDLTTNGFGTFNGSVDLPEETELGSYMIFAVAGGEEFREEFQVAEYRKPEFRTELSFDKDYFIAGTPIKAVVRASYYFGAPVANARVYYTVYRSQAGGYGDFYGDFGYSDSDYGYGEYILDGSGRTDSEGRLHLSIPTDRSTKDDMNYTVEVDVTDSSLRTISASGSVLVPKGLFRLQADTDSYLYRPGDPVRVSIQARDYEKRPRGNANVRVRVDEEVWEYEAHRYSHLTSGEVTTGADGSAEFTFSPPEDGYFRVQVEAVDRLKNTIQGEAWVWVAGDDYEGSGYRGREIKIVCDKDVYRIGETARVMITTSAKDAYALLTVEGADLFQHRMIRLNGGSAVVELEAKREYVPNAFISVCLVDGKNFISNEVPFKVSPAFKFVNVSVTSDKEVYHPGDKAAYTVRTVNADGRPVSAEVSLGVVDESVYALMEDRTPDLREFFYGPRGNNVGTAHSFPDYYMGGADKEGFTGKVRKKFPDTAFWSPTVVTGDDGEATVTVDVPDSLTTWRATARAVTADTEVGWVTHKARARKDLLVRLQTPRFFTQRDELSIGATLHNYTDRKQRVRLWLKAQGLEVKGDLDRVVSIAPNGVMRFEWPVKAVTSGTALLQVYAQGETDSDAVELETPILPHGLDRIRTANGMVDREGIVRFNAPAHAIPETVKMELRLCPTAAGTMLGSLDYLMGYPYGCVEQTLSRFLPVVVASDTLRMLGRRDEALEKRLPDMVGVGLRRLNGFQNGDGGWGWWEDESSPYTTAYVVYGLTIAKKAGHSVDPRTLERGIHSLESQLVRVQQALQVRTPDQPPFADPTERIYMLYALALNGRADVRHVDGIYKDRKKLTAYGRSLLALTLYEMGDREKADRVAGELRSELKQFKGMSRWDVDESGWGWADSSVEATAYGLRALTRRDPKDSRLEEIVRWLAMKRSGNRWNSTKDTAAVVYALAEYVRARTDMAQPYYSAEIVLNGRSQGTVRITRENVFKKEISVALKPEDYRVGENTITIRKNGEGPLYYAAALRYYSLEEDIKPSSSGIEVKREYFILKPQRQSNGRMEMKPSPIGSRVNIADLILCRLTVTSNDNYHYVMIEDPRPAGWEPVEQLSDTGYYGYYEEDWAPWTRMEVRDEKVAVFATRLPKGKWTTEYYMRAEVPGEFHSLPTTASGMYAPQVNGNGPERRVRVR